MLRLITQSDLQQYPIGQVIQVLQDNPYIEQLVSEERYEPAFSALRSEMQSYILSLRAQITSSTAWEEFNLVQLRRVQRTWRTNYIGSAHETFLKYLEGNDHTLNPQTTYGRFLPVVQSSGAGKSRLIDVHSTHVPGICFTLRLPDQSGYPPGDMEITTFLLQSTFSGTQSTAEHATIISLLAATTKNCRALPCHMI